MEINERTVSERMASWRRERHMSQEQLAERLDVSVMTIKRMESNRQTISLVRAMEIAYILGCSVNDFIADTVENPWYNRFISLLASCTNEELDFLFDTIQAMLVVFRNHEHTPK